ncbi:hypothetical protein ACEUZ9_001067 [Paracoccus litorisediminis]|uniref:hypothetical protein n=1 Tax=Paracoccus litorisediminis TaxID=2006130 RepID=UPI003732E613
MSETSRYYLLKNPTVLEEGCAEWIAEIVQSFASKHMAAQVWFNLDCLGCDNHAFPGWRYAVRETEIILRNPRGSSEICRDDLCDYWMPDDLDRLFTPLPGEQYEDPSSCKSLEIEECLGLEKESGCLLVKAGGTIHRIIWEYGEWTMGGAPIGPYDEWDGLHHEPQHGP